MSETAPISSPEATRAGNAAASTATTDGLTERLSLRARVFLFFALIAVVTVGALGAAGYSIVAKLGMDALEPIVVALLPAAFAIVGATLWVSLKFDEHVALPILSIAREVRAAVHAGSERDFARGTGRYLGFLAPAAREVIGAMTEARRETKKAVDAAVADADRRKSQLEAVLRDLQQGVIISTLDHTLLLYNRRALEILHVTGEVGLGRPLTRFVAAQPLRHALARLVARFRSGRHKTHKDGLSVLVTTTTRTEHATLNGRMALTLDTEGREPIGYVVVFEDVTDALAAGVWRDRLMTDVTQDMRQRVANLAMAAELLLADRDLDAETLDGARRILREEPRTLAERLERLDEAAGDLLAGAWPMGAVLSASLLSLAAERRSEGRDLAVEVEGHPCWLMCDGASVVELIDRILNRAAVWSDTTVFSLAATRDGDRATIDIRWRGDAVPDSVLCLWLDERLDDGLGSITGRDVLSRHKTEMWSTTVDGRALVRLPLSIARDYHDRPEKSATPMPERPEFYDFDLFAAGAASGLATRLDRASFVVFDTETTGLEPARGDEMISIAGVRIVNGRVLRGEVFNAFVNPGRAIPPASTKIHGITDAMVAEAERIETVLPRFREFVGDAVLVAHNAAFDMKFLTLKQDRCGVRFDDVPVIDTVLLAAHLFGAGESLTLDTLANRFGITIREEDRHTALGDAIATADVLIRLIDLLKGTGITTLAGAMDASNQQVAIRKQQKKAY